MMPAALTQRAGELAAAGVEFVTATVVRAQRPTSAEPGNVALVLADGSIEGFVGGSCAEHSVRAYALEAIRGGEPILLRILPFDGEAERVAAEDGAVTVQNPCLSGGAIEVFLEPSLRTPRVLVEGDTPIARAVRRLGPELGLDVVSVAGEFELRPSDLGLLAAGHGRDELGALRRALEAGLPYVGLVASRRRGHGVLGELRGDGVPDGLLERIDTPAGLDIGARTPSEIAVSILARIVAVRRGHRSAPTPPTAASPPAGTAGSAPAAASAVDPVCGMTVVLAADTPSLEHRGETASFCGEGCKAAFAAQLANVAD